MNGAQSTGAVKLEKTLGGLVSGFARSKPSPISADEVETKWIDNLGTLPEQMQKLSHVDKLTAHGARVVGSGATLTTSVSGVERVAETAKSIADVTKCVAGVSALFHLVSQTAQGVSRCVEANRGRRVLPSALGRIEILLEYVLERLAEIMEASRGVNEMEIEFVFDALKQAVDAIDMAESQILRRHGSEFVNVEDVKEVERKIERLRYMAVTAGNTSKICTVDEKMHHLEEERKTSDDGLHHVRPSISAFFSSRTTELDTLRDIVEKWGSAVITQYGGVGKTELMIALADRAERDGMVPGGVFWLTVDSGERETIGSLAG